MIACGIGIFILFKDHNFNFSATKCRDLKKEMWNEKKNSQDFLGFDIFIMP